MSTFDERVLSLTPGTRVELYDVDLIPFGGGVERFTTNREDLTPAQVHRFSDSSTGAAAYAEFRLTDYAQVGDDVSLSFYARKTSGASFPYLRFADNNGNINATPWNPADLSYNEWLAGSGVLTGYSVTMTQAGEYVFLVVRGKVSTADDVFVRLFPAYGLQAAPWHYDTTAEGALDVFGLQVAVRRGGVFLPRMLPDHSDLWEVPNGLSLTVVDNEHQALKVPVWDGSVYTPLPVQATGFERTGQGQFPRPVLSVSNIAGTGGYLVQSFGDIRGAEVTRTRVFADNLDNGIDPDPAAYFAPDVFVINRKTKENSTVIEFELVSRLDQQGAKLPARQVLRDVCPWVYRRWDAEANGGAGAFVYEDADVGCPYTGSNYFDVNGDPVTNPEDDTCSKRLATGCRARYGKDEELPFGGFPMVGRRNN